MKAIYFFAAITLLAGCSQHTTAGRIELDTEQQRTSYALGYKVSEQVFTQFQDVDSNALLAGVQAHLQPDGEALVSDEDMDALIAEYQRVQSEKKEAEAARIALENLEAGERFRAHNAENISVVSLESGVQYEVLAAGNGSVRPSPDDTVTVHYHGTLVDGRVFDSSIDRDEPSTFSLKEVISGFQEAVTLMTVGDKWRIVIPPELAYRERTIGEVGANSTLVFEVELLEINPES